MKTPAMVGSLNSQTPPTTTVGDVVVHHVNAPAAEDLIDSDRDADPAGAYSLGAYSPKPHHNSRRSLAETGPVQSTSLLTPTSPQGLNESPSGSLLRSPVALMGPPQPLSKRYSEYFRQVQGELVVGCRCTESYYCSTSDDTGDVYRTKGKQILMICPPPAPPQTEDDAYPEPLPPIQLKKRSARK